MEWSECISKAISYIEDHITEELTIKDISKEAMVSPYYFQKGFAMLCGFTVGEYIKKRRLAVAGMELISTDRKIIDIALQYGYDSPDGFTRAFTRFHGATPAGIILKCTMTQESIPMEPRIRTIIVKSGFLCEENKITSLCLKGETASSIDIIVEAVFCYWDLTIGT